jgi:hypothetical protein
MDLVFSSIFPSTLRRDKKRAEQDRAQRAGLQPDAGGQVEHAVKEHGDVPQHPSDPADSTMTVKSKKKREEKRENRGQGFWGEQFVWIGHLQNLAYNLGALMVERAALLPFDPPILWDEDISLWDFVLEQGRSGREPKQELISLKEKISANTGPRSPMMREFWAALSFGMTVFSCQDGIHLGWRRRPGLDGGLGGSSWNVEQVKELRLYLWGSKIYFTACLGSRVTSLQAEKRRKEEGGNMHGDCVSAWDTRPSGLTLRLSFSFFISYFDFALQSTLLISRSIFGDAYLQSCPIS